MNLFAQPGAVIAILVFLLFPIFWCGILAGIALFGGWHELARNFRAEQTTFRIAEANDGRRFRCASMSMGSNYFPTNYGSCLTIRVSCEGIDVKVWPMFRVLHPPLRIPWSTIERCEQETFFLAFTRTAVYLKSHRYPLSFNGAAGREIFDAWMRQGGLNARRE